MSYILSNILSDILSDMLSDILSDTLSNMMDGWPAGYPWMDAWAADGSDGGRGNGGRTVLGRIFELRNKGLRHAKKKHHAI